MTASLASVAAGCALILPLSGGQPLAVASQRTMTPARTHLGYPDRVGTMRPDYYDCAGLVAAAYRSAGYVMPFSETKESSGGAYVALGELQPRDVVVWGSPVHSVSISPATASSSSPTALTTGSAR